MKIYMCHDLNLIRPKAIHNYFENTKKSDELSGKRKATEGISDLDLKYNFEASILKELQVSITMNDRKSIQDDFGTKRK